jgi:hypothetical protein
VRDDGVLLSLTYDRKRDCLAWARHQFSDAAEDAAVESVCVVSEGGTEALYLAIRRSAGEACYIERLSSFVAPANPALRVHCDSAVVTPPRITGGKIYLDTPVGANYPVLVDVGSTFSFEPGDVGQSISLDTTDPSAPLYRIVVFDSATQVQIVAFTPIPDAQFTDLQTNGTANWKIYRTTVELGHLSHAAQDPGEVSSVRGVTVLADGNVLSPSEYTFAAGTVVLLAPAESVVAGLAYNRDIETLDLIVPQAELRNRYKRVVRTGFELASSYSFWAGQTFSTLLERRARDVTDGYSPLPAETDYREEFVTGSFDKKGQVCFRAFAPTSVVISSVLREVELGGT